MKEAAGMTPNQSGKTPGGSRSRGAGEEQDLGELELFIRHPQGVSSKPLDMGGKRSSRQYMDGTDTLRGDDITRGADQCVSTAPQGHRTDRSWRKR